MYENKFMYDNNFALRISKLRTQKGVSARDMSLSIGQNAGYIKNIETGKALPSMTSFFYICEYLGITPQEHVNNITGQFLALMILLMGIGGERVKGKFVRLPHRQDRHFEA